MPDKGKRTLATNPQPLRARSQLTDMNVNMRRGDRVFFASKRIEGHLSLSSAVRRRGTDGRHLFAGTQEVATRYLETGRLRYCVKFTRAVQFVDFYKEYDRLVALEPRLAEVVFYTTTGGVLKWERRSHRVDDAQIFNSLAEQMTGCDGLFLSGKGNFHAEHIIFDGDHADVFLCKDEGGAWRPIEPEQAGTSTLPSAPLAEPSVSPSEPSAEPSLLPSWTPRTPSRPPTPDNDMHEPLPLGDLELNLELPPFDM